MAFRDDRLADRARIEALEAENAALRDQLAASAGGGEATSRRHERTIARLRWALVGLAGLLFVGAFVSGWVVSGYVGERVGIALGVLGVLLLGLLVPLRMLLVIGPDEVAVLSGRPHRLPDGTLIGYRVVGAGRALRIPILEQEDRLDMRALPFELLVRGLIAREGRATVRLRGDVRLARGGPELRRAVERFLGRSREEVRKVAEEVLEGVVREVIAGVRPAVMREDRAGLVHELRRVALGELDKLGLELDRLELLDVEPHA